VTKPIRSHRSCAVKPRTNLDLRNCCL
jgi:hypothetical protein